MSIEAMAFIFGGLLIGAGVFGDSLQVKDLKLPKLAGWARIASVIIGIAFIALAVSLNLKLLPIDAGHPSQSTKTFQPQTFQSQTANFSGEWAMHADGWMFILNIQQQGNTVTGTMTGSNNDQKSEIIGIVNGTEISFTRTGDAAGQQYKGYLFNGSFRNVPTNTDNNNAVAGIAKPNNPGPSFGWYATR